MIDAFQRFLFEDQTVLLFSCFVAMMLVIGIHRHFFTPRTRTAVWITLGVCTFFIIQQIVVVTDREKLRALTEQLAEAVEAPDLEAIADFLAEDFIYDRGVPRDKAAFMQQLNVTLQHYQINNASIWEFKRIDVADGEADVEFRATCDLVVDGYTQNFLTSRWELHCVQRDEQWQVQQITPLQIGNQDADAFDVLR